MAMTKLPATIAASTAQPHPGVLRWPGIGKCCQKSLTGTLFPALLEPRRRIDRAPVDGGHGGLRAPGVDPQRRADHVFVRAGVTPGRPRSVAVGLPASPIGYFLTVARLPLALASLLVRPSSGSLPPRRWSAPLKVRVSAVACCSYSASH